MLMEEPQVLLDQEDAYRRSTAAPKECPSATLVLNCDFESVHRYLTRNREYRNSDVGRTKGSITRDKE